MGSCISQSQSQPQKVYPITINGNYFVSLEEIEIRVKLYLINRENYKIYNYDNEYIGIYDEYRKGIIK